jgi:hypothetical protein
LKEREIMEAVTVWINNPELVCPSSSAPELYMGGFSSDPSNTEKIMNKDEINCYIQGLSL